MKQFVAPMQLRSALGDHARKVTWLELFFDLIFVAAVAQVAEPLREHYTLTELARLAPLLVLIWWAWVGHTVFATRFDTDDIAQRVLTLMQMFVVAVMAANAKEALDSRSSAGFAAAYAVMRFFLVGQYFRARHVRDARPLATCYLVGHGIAAVIWLTSAFVPAPARFVLWALAFAIDLTTPWLAVRHSVRVPPDASHLPERFGLFTLILLGDSVIAVMQGMESQEAWAPSAAVSAFLAMAILFVLWWWYFDGVSGASERAVRTKREAQWFHVWSYVHFPLYLGIIVGGVGLRRIVTAASRATLEPSEAFILLTAIAVVMIAMTVIGATSADRNQRDRIAWVLHFALAAATIAMSFTGRFTSPTALIVAIAMVSFAQLCVSLINVQSVEAYMRKTVFRRKARTVRQHSLTLVAALIAATTLGAQSLGEKETARAVQRALQRLPYYGVFDFMAFGVEKGTVTLAGYAYQGNLKADAARAVKRVPGIDEVANTIEILPASPNDDRIRWATFYKIYTDDFLSRYAPGGAMMARYEALSFLRFPGMQPFGMYPIHIVVKNGRTTLVGVVDNQSDKTIAGLRAREVDQVFSVENELMVREGN